MLSGFRILGTAPTSLYRTFTLYPPSPSSNLHSFTSAYSSPCSRLFTRPRSTGPFGEPFPLPVMMRTTAPALRRCQVSRNVRTAAGPSAALNPGRSSSASARASSSESVESKTGWRPLPRLPIPDQLLELLQQLHHRPRIAFTIVEQVLPHPVVLLPRDLPRHKQQPSDLHARDATIHDHQVVVGQLRDERREDLLETKAPVEAGVVHAVPHHRMEIDRSEER